jgi:hypothetical protein
MRWIGPGMIVALAGCPMPVMKSDSDTASTEQRDTDPPVDADGDGYTASIDCDDQDPAIHPDADDVCANGVDEDCDGADAPCETDVDVDTDTDTDADTGVATLYYRGDFTSDAVSATGHFGYAAFGHAVGDWVCTTQGDLTSTGAAPACPNCDWAFQFGPLENSTVDNPAVCDDFGWSAGAMDGYFDYAWGFAGTYAYDYGGVVYESQDAVLVYVYDYWLVLAANLPAYGVYQTYGDASYVTFERPIGSRTTYYYYYP